MVFEHIGHAEFLITLESGLRIATDPFDAGCGYPIRKVEADCVLVSHHHSDHDAVENIAGHPQVLDYAGVHTLAPGVSVTALLGDHDDAGGSKRGKTLLFLLEAEGLRIAHLGDLGRALNPEELAVLQGTDVLMIPTGGFYTIDAETAKRTAEELEARIILPMHYKTEYNRDWPIESVSRFTGLFDSRDVRTDGKALRVTKGDLDCHPHVVVL